jgi:ABC-type sugar transport system permease subunit
MKMTRRHREWLFGYLFISIWIIGLILFTIFPVIQSFVYSMREVRISVGELEIIKDLAFENYRQAFTYIYFVEALWNYVQATVITIPAIVVFAVIFGLLLNQKSRGIGIFRTIFFLPVIISSGPVLSKIQSEGAMMIPGLQDSAWLLLIQNNLPDVLNNGIDSLFSRIVIILWFTGVPTILILAGLQKMDRAIYEAAAIDGASAWETFWKITLPALRPLINIIVVFSMVSISIFSSSEIASIIDSRKYTQYGLTNAFAWIHFAVSFFLLLIFLGLINMRVGRTSGRKIKGGKANAT